MGYVSNRDNAMDEIIRAGLAGLNDTAEDVGDKARALVNKDKRDLEQSITVEPAKREGDKLVVEVHTDDVNYALDQEFGARGKPYFRPAVKSKASLDSINANIQKHYR